MWILPRQLHTSPYVPDTAALISDSEEQSQAFAQSLFVRSKPSPSRTWSQKWRRDSWTRHLSGRMLRPSHGPGFLAAWTSSLGDIHASPSAQRGSGSDTMTPGTSGPSLPTESESSGPGSASSRTSMDTSRWDSPQLSATWKTLVTKSRLEYSARLKSAHRTNASGCSSWPTASARDYKGANGPEHMAKGGRAHMGQLPNAVMYGPPAPANPSTGGSRPGLWLTPRANEPDGDHNFVARNADRGDHCHPSLSQQAKAQGKMWATPKATNGDCPVVHNPRRSDGGQPNLAAQMELEQRRQGQWRTPTSHDWKNTDCSTQVYLSDQVEGRTAKQWPTPSVPNGGQTTAGAEDKGTKKQVRLEHAVTGQWATPVVADSVGNPREMEKRLKDDRQTRNPESAGSYKMDLEHAVTGQWATPRSGKTTAENPEVWAARQARGDVATMPLGAQVTAWATPNCTDGKTGSTTTQGRSLVADVRSSGKLNPSTGKLNSAWVCCLMGLPIGWVSPSCPASVIRNWPRFIAGWFRATIAQTSCACLETGSCQRPPNSPSEPCSPNSSLDATLPGDDNPA